jgi:hypothetical protein
VDLARVALARAARDVVVVAVQVARPGPMVRVGPAVRTSAVTAVPARRAVRRTALVRLMMSHGAALMVLQLEALGVEAATVIAVRMDHVPRVVAAWDLVAPADSVLREVALAARVDSVVPVADRRARSCHPQLSTS